MYIYISILYPIARIWWMTMNQRPPFDRGGRCYGKMIMKPPDENRLCLRLILEVLAGEILLCCIPESTS